MIDIEKAKNEFESFLTKYKSQDELGFEMKVVHTYHVVDSAKQIAENLNLDPEDIKLAELIGLLHDIGRFEEYNALKGYDSVKFDHASVGVKMLFDNGLIRSFIEDNRYDDIIKLAIDTHSRLDIPENLTDKQLLHVKIIRDADKLDNFRIKSTEQIEALFPGQVSTQLEFESSKISNIVYNHVVNHKCVNIKDRKHPLDYYLCVLAFVYDINFDVTLKIIKEKDYINKLIDRFNYLDDDTKKQMEEIKNILVAYIDNKIGI